MLFAPGKRLSALVLLGLLILLGLGTWQARKVAPKLALIEAITSGLAADPLPLNQLLARDSEPRDYRRVTVTGQFLAGEGLALYGTNLSGRSGKHIYGVIQTRAGDHVVASIGWVPFEAALPKLPSGEQRFTGVLTPAGQRGPFTSDNDPGRNFWYWADLDAMAAVFDAPLSLDHRLILDRAEQRAPGAAIGGQVRVNIPNDHFEYALTWYGLALALFGVYVAYGFQRGRQLADEGTGL